ncbi:ethanolamine ammonia-lyase reactivating factor EutA, partial [Salmonella enterica subsp. enterica serovar Virginia]|nr:ethanolamine ammonia-lyase reactivating factor EutA [Salmonella enterica subsp. enterica serovar Virginia]
ALHEHPRLREMNVQFPAQTVRATVIGAGAHTLSLSGSTIWLEGASFPVSAKLGAAAFLLAVIIGVSAGVIAALKQNTRWDYTVMG